MTLDSVDTKPTIGVITVKLSEQGDLNDAAIKIDALAQSQLLRFGNLGDFSDLENAISNISMAVELTPYRHPNKPWYLSDLADSFRIRFEHLGALSDLENAISIAAEAVGLTDDGHPDKPLYLSNLGCYQDIRFEHLGALSDLENAISNMEMAVQLTDDVHPDKPMYLSNLGGSQETRFEYLSDLSDLEHAVSNQEKAVELSHDAHPMKAGRLSNLGIIQHTCFQRFGDLSVLDNAISNQEKAVKITDDGDPDKPMYLSNLGISQRTRFESLDNLSDLENAIQNMEKAVQLSSSPSRLSNLGFTQLNRFEHLGSTSDLEHAISNITKAAELTDDTHPRKPHYLSNLGWSQKTRFERFGDLLDLDNSISNLQKAVELTDDSNSRKTGHLLNLGIAWRTRFEHLGEQADLAAAVSLFKSAAQIDSAYPHQALLAARPWAAASHLNGDLQSALEGYRTALELLPKVAWLGLNIPSRQHWLVEETSDHLGCLAATCAIQLGRFEEAVEFLDMSRSVIWHQAASLRSDLKTLKEEEPRLAKELEIISRQLDAQHFFDSASTAGECRDDRRSGEGFGKERRQLASEWERLVEAVRQLPKFKYFLRPIPFDQIRQVLSGGHVVIINASEYGVDALIFGTSGPIGHVPLPDTDLETLAELSSDIVLRQPAHTSANQRRSYNIRFLKPALRTIWNDIIVHIFNKIQFPLTSTEVLPRHRIWWYPTGPLTFIPIHAAGPGCGTIDVSRLVISSYVTTLGSLSQARKKNAPVVKLQQRFLSISQSETPGESALPQTTEEVGAVAEVFRSSGWPEDDIISLHSSEATVDHVSRALDTCSWVHFACHGSQDNKLGVQSGFSLHDGHLKLSEIASKKLSAGQFAFLSACHAASGLKDLPGEAMHLAASIQFAGFPSVIATLWRIRDEDAPRVADHTYRYIFRHGLQGLDPSEAAAALNRAVLRLREDTDVTVDRWAPFVHFGI
jgi:tetratricopeptide (TPR) repeat protein